MIFVFLNSVRYVFGTFSSSVVRAIIYDFLLITKKFLGNPVKTNFAYYGIPGNLGILGKPGEFEKIVHAGIPGKCSRKSRNPGEEKVSPETEHYSEVLNLSYSNYYRS